MNVHIQPAHCEGLLCMLLMLLLQKHYSLWQ